MSDLIEAPMPTLSVRPEYLRGTLPPPERRRYRRFEIELDGRVLRTLTKQEFSCRLFDLSLGGAHMLADHVPLVDELVIIHIAELGPLEGRVSRAVAGGFAIEFSISHRRRQRLAAQITWLLNRHELDAVSQRRAGHDRIAATGKPATVTFPDSTSLECNLIDVSVSGASIAMSERPEIGSKIVLGRHPARIVRHHDRGVGVEFIRVQVLDRIRDEFG